MTVMTRKFVLALTLAALAGALAACSATTTVAPTEPSGPSAPVVLDVRTAEEFAAGHLRGALNVDVNAADFEQRLGSLDPAGTYQIYCRSGNRSAQAVERMRQLGFVDLQDLGSVAEASAVTGLEVVR